MSVNNRFLSRAVAVSLTSMALTCSGVASAQADSGQGQANSPAHAPGGTKSKSPGSPGHQGTRGHQGDPGHQGTRGHQGNPGHQGSKGGNQGQGTPGGPSGSQQGGPDGGTPATPGDDVKGTGHNPPGNNGTVKIEQLQADGTPQNNPHQTCQLRVEWYGFDEGDDVVSELSFDAIAPTSGSSIAVDGDTSVPVGGDPASGAGTDTGLDGSEVYTLSFTGEPHAQQGYHVKLTVHTPYSLGNDSKSKVFWMEPCTAGGSGTAARTAPAGTDAPAASSGVQPGASESVVSGDPREGNGADGVPVPTAVDAGGDESDWAPAALPFGLLALGSGLAAAAVHVRRRATLG